MTSEMKCSCGYPITSCTRKATDCALFMPRTSQTAVDLLGSTPHCDQATDEQKAAAFEWLREHALTDDYGSYYARVLLQEIAGLKSAESEKRECKRCNYPNCFCERKP